VYYKDDQEILNQHYTAQQCNRRHQTSPPVLPSWITLSIRHDGVADYGQRWRHPQNRKCTHCPITQVSSVWFVIVSWGITTTSHIRDCTACSGSVELAGLCDRRDTSKTVHTGNTETPWSLHWLDAVFCWCTQSLIHHSTLSTWKQRPRSRKSWCLM